MPAADSSPRLREDMVVSTAWLAEHLHDPNLVVLCIATNRAFYEQGHIPGARLVMLDRLVSQGANLNEIPPVAQLRELFESVGVTRKSRIVLYGERSGMLAARAYFTLDYLGLANHAALLDGGIEKWRAEHRSESTDTPSEPRSRLDISSAAHPAIVATLEQVRRWSAEHNRHVALIDARPRDEYTGDKFSEDVPKAGHIPGATHLYWMDLLASRENPVLRPTAELRRAFESAAAGNGEIVTYCRTGMQASFTYFVAKYLGYRPRMYDASFYEWSRADAPVEKTQTTIAPSR